jgi:predicted GH43/DUF377 family glycosyl hydrolase
VKISTLYWISAFFCHLYCSSAKLEIHCPHPKFQEWGCIEQNRSLDIKKKQIVLNGFQGAYNPTIVARQEGGYTLFFRFDVHCDHYFKKTRLVYLTYLGYVDLDENLDVLHPPALLPMLSPYCEDPRVVLFQGQYALFFNDVLKEDPSKRVMKLALIDPKTKKILKVKKFPGQTRKIEKNWTPFVLTVEGKERLFYVYEFNDLSVYEVLIDGHRWDTQKLHSKSLENPKIQEWIKKYGPLRGGAPLLEIEGKLWSFFHSYFYETVFERGRNRNQYFYHMGVMTLDQNATKVERLLPFPLLYDDAYQTPRERSREKWVVYPSGALYNPVDQSILISVGENDGAIFLLKMDKHQLESKMEFVGA